mmetsp:Transcript_8507/g.18638  ORF Transcript_8507/g.18638 Transcript_8507/m.18638 type:complete len:210 (+) Transcript_8507:1290-1919(+)
MFAWVPDICGDSFAAAVRNRAQQTSGCDVGGGGRTSPPQWPRGPRPGRCAAGPALRMVGMPCRGGSRWADPVPDGVARRAVQGAGRVCGQTRGGGREAWSLRRSCRVFTRRSYGTDAGGSREGKLRCVLLRGHLPRPRAQRHLRFPVHHPLRPHLGPSQRRVPRGGRQIGGVFRHRRKAPSWAGSCGALAVNGFVNLPGCRRFCQAACA